MSAITVGFTNPQKMGPAILILGPEVPDAEHFKLSNDANTGKLVKLPKGVVLGAVYEVGEPTSTFITDETRAQARAKKEAKAQAAADLSKPAVGATTQHKTTNIEHHMKKLSIIAATLLSAASLQAASWSLAASTARSYNPVFSGNGVPFAVVTSVQSNSLVSITSGGNAGAPVIDSIWINPDLTAGTLRFYVPTNSLFIASNSPTIGSGSSNILWLVGTNSTLATNDLLVVKSGDTYQMTILSGNATDYAGTVYTNASGYTAIKIFNVLTNPPVAGDIVYKMAQVVSLTPLALQNATNDVAVPWGTPTVPAWWQVATRAGPFTFNGVVGLPLMTILTYSNSAGLIVNGHHEKP